MDIGTMDNMARPDEPGLVDIRAVIGVIRRRAVVIITVIAAALTLTALAYWMTEPVYHANARVALERQVEEIVQTDSDRRLQVPTDSPTVDTEVQIIRSAAVAAAVVDRLDLAGMPGFGGADAIAADGSDDARARAIDVVRSRLAVNREGLSYAIAIGFSWDDPELTAAIVNATLAAYMETQRSGLFAGTQEEVEILRERLEQLRDDVLSAEAAVARYRERTDLVDIYDDAATAQQQIATLNGLRASARAAQAAAEARLAAANQADGNAAPDVLSSSLIRQLRAQEAEIVAERASLSEIYGSGHPDMMRVESALAAVRAEIDAETARIRTSLIAEANAAGNETAALNGSIGAVQQTLRAGNRTAVRLAELERNAEAARVLYQALLERYREAVTAQGTERGNAYIISAASVPRNPVSPNLTVYALAGALAALGAVALVILLLEMLERGLRTRKDVADALELPVLASLPDLKTGRKKTDERPILGFDDAMEATESGAMFAEACRALALELQVGRHSQVARSVAISSAVPDEGKSTLALGLVRSVARAGHRAVLIDGDYRKRTLSRAFSNGGPDLADILQSRASADDALIADPDSGAMILPLSGDTEAMGDLIASDAMEVLIARLGDHHDLIVIDTAPVLAVAAGPVLAAMADRTIFAVRWRKTPARAAQTAMEQLERAGAHVAGAALARVDLRAQARAGLDDETYLYREYAPQNV